MAPTKQGGIRKGMGRHWQVSSSPLMGMHKTGTPRWALIYVLTSYSLKVSISVSSPAPIVLRINLIKFTHSYDNSLAGGTDVEINTLSKLHYESEDGLDKENAHQTQVVNRFSNPFPWVQQRRMNNDLIGVNFRKIRFPWKIGKRVVGHTKKRFAEYRNE
jgi:hypothetical protein